MENIPFLEELNIQQKAACIEEKNLLLKACPGSGKTRTLTYKLAYLVTKYECSNKLNIAITYTNRAAEEISERLEKLGIASNKIWVGTIHQFCLEFIIRPYTIYHKRLNKGYHIIDEYIAGKYISAIAKELNISIKYGKNPLDNPNMAEKYHNKLLTERELDFDSILSVANELLHQNEFIAENIAGIVRAILVDEYQDTNEMQYVILSKIVKTNKSIQIAFFGDTDQAIYGGLGGVAKSSDELRELFEVEFCERNLDGCYRSTQRIVDYYANFQTQHTPIYAVSDIKNQKGHLLYNSSIDSKILYENIAQIVENELANGILEEEICIIAPQWWLLFPLAKKMKELLPQVKFDAPSITPIKYDPMNPFYLLSRLVFSEPGKRTSLRKRIASELVAMLRGEYKIYLSEKIDSYSILKIINSSKGTETNGVVYLKNTIDNFFERLGIDINKEPRLQKMYEEFVSAICDRVVKYSLSTDVEVFKQCFKEKEGVVINTFHGVKGEEYTTVIAFGILNGYIPHWDIIINKTPQYREVETKKLLYVVCSRAKKNLYLFSEQGRTTQKGNLLTATDEIVEVSYNYDGEFN